MADDAEKTMLENLVKQMAAKLGEHMDSVQIICTRKVGCNTRMHHFGLGDWYARYGAIRYWLAHQDAECTAETIADFRKGDSPDAPF
jgi:hypothetical protein